MIFYLLNKYFFLGALIAGQIQDNHDRSRPIDCTTSFRAAIFLGNMSLGLAGVNLAIRTIAIWNRNTRLIAALALLMAGHWALIVTFAAGVKSEYIPNMGCGPPQFNQSILIAILVYSLCFDALICGLNWFKLRSQARLLLNRSKKTVFELTQVVLFQGLGYFVIAFLINVSTIIMLAVNVSPPIFSTYIAVAEGIISIVACRAVRSLSNVLMNATDIPAHPTLGHSMSTIRVPQNSRSLTEDFNSGYDQKSTPLTVLTTVERSTV
ncbi:hypothetical protein CPB83DRAFT_911287 [Crepidotus variabilis]|uniref:Uncharacterized protein n=1 Tax=Crepidotus variabilis TaxID=179855 RepID=A0A9P6E4X5_9AGAR|nr:hypothetical protein CPB83DRAFT_911287 [Crepidotus variabilis]